MGGKQAPGTDYNLNRHYPVYRFVEFSREYSNQGKKEIRKLQHSLQDAAKYASIDADMIHVRIAGLIKEEESSWKVKVRTIQNLQRELPQLPNYQQESILKKRERRRHQEQEYILQLDRCYLFLMGQRSLQDLQGLPNVLDIIVSQIKSLEFFESRISGTLLQDRADVDESELSEVMGKLNSNMALQCFCPSRVKGYVHNLERLECLGDSFLKFATTLYLSQQAYHHPDWDEEQLSIRRQLMVSNGTLCRIACRLNVQDFVKDQNFGIFQNLDVLPFHTTNPNGQNTQLKKQGFQGKLLADVIEASVGCMLLTYGWSFTFKYLRTLGIIPDDVEVLQRCIDNLAKPFEQILSQTNDSLGEAQVRSPDPMVKKSIDYVKDQVLGKTQEDTQSVPSKLLYLQKLNTYIENVINPHHLPPPKDPYTQSNPIPNPLGMDEPNPLGDYESKPLGNTEQKPLQINEEKFLRDNQSKTLQNTKASIRIDIYHLHSMFQENKITQSEWGLKDFNYVSSTNDQSFWQRVEDDQILKMMCQCVGEQATNRPDQHQNTWDSENGYAYSKSNIDNSGDNNSNNTGNNNINNTGNNNSNNTYNNNSNNTSNSYGNSNNNSSKDAGNNGSYNYNTINMGSTMEDKNDTKQFLKQKLGSLLGVNRNTREDVQFYDYEALDLPDQLLKYLGYRFESPVIVKAALTHPCMQGSQISPLQQVFDYEVLEFLGDAALDFFYGLYIYLKYPCIPQGIITFLRHLALNNQRLARLSIYRGLPFYLKHNQQVIQDQVLEIIGQFQEDTNEKLDEDALDSSCRDFDQFLQPTFGSDRIINKMMSDVFESTVGGILADAQDMKHACFKILDLLSPLEIKEKDFFHPKMQFLMLAQHLNLSNPVEIWDEFEEFQVREGIPIQKMKFVCTVKVGKRELSVSVKSPQKSGASLDAYQKAVQQIQSEDVVRQLQEQQNEQNDHDDYRGQIDPDVDSSIQELDQDIDGDIMMTQA